MSHTSLFFNNVISIIQYEHYINTLDYLLQSVHFIVKNDQFIQHMNQLKHYPDLNQDDNLIYFIMIHLYIKNHNQYMAIEYELLIFKILIYIYIIILPNNIKMYLTCSQKRTIFNDCLTIYEQLLKSKKLEYIIIELQMESKKHFFDCFHSNTHYLEQKLNHIVFKLSI